LITDTTESQFLGQLKKLKNHALKVGVAVGIAHPRQETACAMAEFFTAEKQGDCLWNMFPE